MNLSIRSLSTLAIANQTKEFDIDEIGVEEGVDIGFGLINSLLLSLVL
jgi:hypothetical protein